MARAKAIHASQPKTATKAPPAVSQNTRGQPPIDFHLFADLAPELQDAIWEFSCYSTPEIIPIFVNDHTFKFQLREVPAVPAVLHATSGARAIGVRHFTLVKFEELARNPPRPPPQPQAQPPQGVLPQAHLQFAPNHAQFLQNQLAWQNGNHLPHAAQGLGWMNIVNILPGPPQPALLAPAPHPQGPNSLALVPYNAQAAVQAQHNSQNQGAIHPLGQQGTQVQGAIHPWFQHHALPPFTVGGGPQQATFQILGQQNIPHQGSQHQVTSAQTSFGGNFQSTSAGQHNFSQNVAHYQSIFGGSQQTTAPGGPNAMQNSSQYQSPYGGTFQSTPAGQQTSTQNGAQQQSIFGGSFQSNPAGQQNNMQNGAHHHLTSQITTFQVFNPSAGAIAALASASTAVVLHHSQPRRRLLPADSDTEDDSDRYFYVNPGSDYFKLQVGGPTRYHYPRYTLTQWPQLLSTVSDEDRQAYLQNMQQAYSPPTPFPAPGRLPDFISNIQHLVINLELAPCHAQMRSDGFRIWLHRQTKRFCEVIIKSTLEKVPQVKNLDLLIEGDFKRRPYDRMVLRHFRQAPIQEENGITFGHAELGLLEMEIRVWLMSEYMGKDGPEGPEVRIVVQVPQHYSQTK